MALQDRRRPGSPRRRAVARDASSGAVATAIALLLTGFAGLGVLETMSTEPLSEALGAIDVVLTGLVAGGGSKPLHDLLVRLEKAKDYADATRH